MRIRRRTSNLLKRAGAALYAGADWVYPPSQPLQAQRVVPWFAIHGDKTLRLEYDLNEHSLVFDLGGFEGQWTSDIFAKFCCSIHVFEPVEKFAAQIERRFCGNRKIIVHRFGLAAKTEKKLIALDQNASSIFKTGAKLEQIRLLQASDFLEHNCITAIDLMKINIEGGEYDLLEHLIEVGWVAKIKNIQVQFHDFVTDAERRMTGIQTKLRRTHFLTYQYPFVWENWRIM